MQPTWTLLLTDLVDSTTVNASVGDDAMAAFWATHDQGSRELARVHHGREVDRSDGFLMLFESTVDAAAFALAYHHMLGTLALPMQARAGIHVGAITVHEATAEDRALGAKPFEVVGLAKALTARLMALAGPGRTLASSDAAAALGASSMPIRSHGCWRFKGFPEPVEVFELGAEGQAARPPQDTEKAFRVVAKDGAWVALTEIRRRLPAERDSFHGRDLELRRLDALVDDGARLVVLHGPGGIGKTRLAVRYAWAWLARFPGGAYFCDFSSARDEAALASVIARTLGLPAANGDRERLATAVAGHGRCLLVLDNCEAAASPVAELAGALLDAAPHLSIVATSRAALDLPGEHRMQVAALAESDAASLFIRRAEAVGAPTLDETALPPLLRLLDGLPLALELAAAQCALLSPADLASELSDRLRLLALRGGGRPSRHATLRAAMEISWHALQPAQRQAAASCAVFEGSFSRAAATAVLAGGAPAVETLEALVKASIVQVREGGRLAMLATLRAFAAEQTDATEQVRAAGRHATFFSTLDERTALHDRCADLENLVSACRYHVARGAGADAAHVLLAAWAAIRLAGPLQTAVSLAIECDAAIAADDPARVAIAWVHAAASFAMGDYAGARRRAAQALDLLCDTTTAALAARVRGLVGELAAIAGDDAAAQGHLQAGAALAERSGEPATRCLLGNALGAWAGDRGRLDEARAHYESALAVAAAADLPSWRGGLLGNLGWVHLATGRLADARKAFEEALLLAETSGDRRWEGNARCNLALVQLEEGRHGEAMAESRRALAIARELGHRVLEATVCCNIGLVHEARDELEPARQHHARAVELAQASGDEAAWVQFSAYLASVLARLGRWPEAKACLEGAPAGACREAPGLRVLILVAQAESEQAAGNDAAAALCLARCEAVVAAGLLAPHEDAYRRFAALRALIRG